ncbi:MAG: arginine--tRNA ligase [Saprospiraceae bacterium]
MDIISIIQTGVIKGIENLYGETISATDITMNATRSEFEGDFTIVVFPFTKMAKKKPEDIANELGNYIVSAVPQINRFNVIKGFLNLVIDDVFWQNLLLSSVENPTFGYAPSNGQKVLVEFSSPNTNKPLHLGHIRNILLGWSSYKILQAAGYEVTRVQIVNDRGIAICKSMLAWKLLGKGTTPASEGMKGDHFVGQYYVKFEQLFQEEYKAWQQTEEAKSIFEEKAPADETADVFFKSFKNTYFNEYSELGQSARAMLIAWEAGDPETVALWKQMNDWVYAGFNTTYQNLGVAFDKLYYESETYLLGKSSIEEGLQKGVFYKKEDGSVWIDLTAAKLDHKIVLRKDGTSVYLTQDIGTAQLRYQDFGVEKMIYVVADEQNYHFQVLFETMKRLGEPYAEGLQHLAYGMVDLPSGKMKSREGTVVDADDLMAEVIAEAKEASRESSEINTFSTEQQQDIFRKIGLAALKFHIIKVHPKKRMVFDPKESVDLQGQTGPYIQYSYVRINGVSQRAEREGVDLMAAQAYVNLEPTERELLRLAYQFPGLIQEAAAALDPSTIANFCYALAKAYSRFWHDVSIFDSEPSAKAFRLLLSKFIGNILKNGMDLLGIEMPEKM